MDRTSLEIVFRALGDGKVRYLVVCGLAVLAHGFLTVTQDVDLVVDLCPPNPERAATVLEALGFRPAVPVALAEFADPEARARWTNEKQARVLPLFSDTHRTVRVDLFIESPFAFDQAMSRCHEAEIGPGLRVSFVGLQDLPAMKRAAGRPRDLIDIERLTELHGRRR
jgi:hypothetical protein